MSKSVRVSNGTQAYDVSPERLMDAVNDGFLPTERVIVVRGKEKFEIEPDKLPAAIGDGFSFFDVKKKDGSPAASNGLAGNVAPAANGLETVGNASVSGTINPASNVLANTTPSASSASPSAASPSPKPETAIDLALKAGALKERDYSPTVTGGTGGAGATASLYDNITKRKAADKMELDELTGKVKEQGFDADELYRDFKDYPEAAYASEVGSKEYLLQLRRQNPVDYQTRINNTKNQYAVYGALVKAEDPETKTKATQAANAYNDLAQYKSYTDVIRNVPVQQRILGEVLSGDERRKAEERLRISAAQRINGNDPDLLTEYNASPLKGKLNQYQYAGLQTLKLFEPGKYEQVLRALDTPIKTTYESQMPTEVLQNVQAPVAIPTTVETTDSLPGSRVSTRTLDEQLGQETILRKLAEIGQSNSAQYLNRRLATYAQQLSAEADPAKKQKIAAKYRAVETALQNVQQQIKDNDAKFPRTTKIKFDQLTKEALDQEPGLANYGALRFAKIIGGIPNAIEDIVNGGDPALQRRRIGQAQDWQNYLYLPSSVNADAPVVPFIPEDVKEQLRSIDRNPVLNKQQKDELAHKLLQDNSDRIETITSAKEGASKNFYSKATAYKMAGFMGDVAGFAMATPTLGAFGSGFLTAYDDAYTRAVEEGNPNPREYATVHAGIMGLAAKYGGRFDYVKKVIGATPALEGALAGVDEATWDAVVKRSAPLIERMAASTLNAAKESAKQALVFGAGVSAAGDLADKVGYGKDISFEQIRDNALHGLKDMVIGGLPLMGVHAITGFRNVPEYRKAAIWELGDNPELQIERIEEARRTNAISPEQAEQRKRTVNEIAGLISKVPRENIMGEPLADKQRVDYLHNLYINGRAKELKGSMPEQEQQRLNETATAADAANSVILNESRNRELAPPTLAEVKREFGDYRLGKYREDRAAQEKGMSSEQEHYFKSAAQDNIEAELPRAITSLQEDINFNRELVKQASGKNKAIQEKELEQHIAELEYLRTLQVRYEQARNNLEAATVAEAAPAVVQPSAPGLQVVTIGGKEAPQGEQRRPARIILPQQVPSGPTITVKAPEVEAVQQSFSERLREAARKLETGEGVPKWLINNDPNMQAKGLTGEDLAKAAATALRLVADAVDKGIEYAQAIERGWQHIKDLYEQSGTRFNEQKVREDYEAYVRARILEQQPADFTAIRKAEITQATELAKKGFAIGGKVAELKSVEQGITRLAEETRPGNSLYDTASDKVATWKASIEAQIEKEGKSTFNPSDEQLAQMMYQRAETARRISEEAKAITSGDEAQMLKAGANFILLRGSMDAVDYVLRESGRVAGRAFRFRQSEARLDSENGLNVRRMQVSEGRELSATEEAQIKALWEREQETLKKTAEAQEKALNDAFEKRVQSEAQRRGKGKDSAEKSIKATGKKVADKIRSLKTNPEARGLQANFFGLAEATYNATLESVALLVEGGATVAEAVKQLVEAGKVKFASGSDRKGFERQVREAVGEKNTLDAIGKQAETEGAKGITVYMVSKGLIREYLHDKIDAGITAKNVLGEGMKELREILPELTEAELRDAYLKEGAYKLPTKAQKNKERLEARRELQSVARLQADIEMLQAEQELRKRHEAPQRERSEYEQQLADEKADLLKQKAEEIRAQKDAEKEAERARKADQKEADRIERRQQRRAEKLRAIDERIADVDQRQRLWKANAGKKEGQIDTELSQKREQLREAVRKSGKRLDSSSTFAKASRREVAEAHNERLNDALREVFDILHTADDLSREDVNALRGAASLLDQARVDASTVEHLQDVLNAGERRLAALVDALSEQAKERPVLKRVATAARKALEALRLSRDKSAQDIALDSYKRSLESRIKTIERDMVAGRFEEAERTIPELDTAATRKEIELRKIESQYREMAARKQREQQGPLLKTLKMLQGLYVAQLISGSKAMFKVATAGVMKPVLETATRATFGQLFGAIFPDLKKAAGAEGFSLKQETERYRAMFGQIGEAKMQQMVERAAERLSNADIAYADALQGAEAIRARFGESSEAYKDYVAHDLNPAKKEQLHALIDHLSLGMYEWLGAKSWTDSKNSLISGVSQIEELMGYGTKADWGKMDGYERVNYLGGFMGAAHSALKGFSARAEFAASFVARLENAARRGEDLRDPDTVMRTAVDSFVNYTMGKYQEDNPVTEAINAALKGVEEMGRRHPKYAKAGEAASVLLRFQYPILRVPVSIVKEMVVDYTLGVFIGSGMLGVKTAKEVRQMIRKGEHVQMGEALRRGISKLTPEQADFVYRCLRKGGFGLMMAALTATGVIGFGGFHTKHGKKDEDEGIVYINGKPMGKLASNAASHWAFTGPALLVANFQKVQSEQDFRGNNGILSGVSANLSAVADMIPVGKEFKNPLTGATLPYVRFYRDIAEMEDVDAAGQKVKRRPEGMADAVKLNTGIDRKAVPEADPQGTARKEVMKQLKAGVDIDNISDSLFTKSGLTRSGVNSFTRNAELSEDELLFKYMKPEDQLKAWENFNPQQKKKYAVHSHLPDAIERLFASDPVLKRKYEKTNDEMQQMADDAWRSPEQ